MVERLNTGGWIILSGLIESDVPVLEPLFADHRANIEKRVEQQDVNQDTWVGLLLRLA